MRKVIWQTMGIVCALLLMWAAVVSAECNTCGQTQEVQLGPRPFYLVNDMPES